MKKILAILLALTCFVGCAFALTSCGKCEEHIDANGDNACDNCGADTTPAPAPQEDECKAFADAIAATKPASLEVTVKTTSELGALQSTYKTVYSTTDSSFTITYRTESFNVTFESEDNVLVNEGTITCDAAGNYSDGGAFVGGNPASTGVVASLDKLTNYTVEGDILVATVAADETLAVFGVQYDATVTLVLTKSEGKIISASLICGTETNGTQISCVYK